MKSKQLSGADNSALSLVIENALIENRLGYIREGMIYATCEHVLSTNSKMYLITTANMCIAEDQLQNIFSDGTIVK